MSSNSHVLSEEHAVPESRTESQTVPELSALPEFHYAYGKPTIEGVLKANPTDFQVYEDLGFVPCGEGEHFFLRIRKVGENTQYVAKLLAKVAGVPARAVSYAGLKDRHALTEQWFGVHLPGKATPDWDALNSDTIQVLEAKRHNKKLRTGVLKGNKFVLRLTDLTATEGLSARLAQIAEQGVPNYFGEQRFGHQGANLKHAQAMFAGKRIRDRNKRSFYLSAARSLLFNEVVSRRIADGYWQQPLAGECFLLPNSNSFFAEPELTDTLQQRWQAGELRLSAPLWGRGELASQSDAQAFETAALAAFETWRDGLEQAGLKQERRAVCLKPQDLQYDLTDDTLTLTFSLPAGAFATSVIRELILTRQPATQVTEQASTEVSNSENSGQ